MIDDLASGAVWGALGAIIVANLLLSGDNAVVIAMAARSLERRQQKLAIVWGSVAAVVMRVLLTVLALELLQLPYLKVAGGALLLWIGVQLLRDCNDHGKVRAHATLAGAVRTILVADLVMSTDNVIAVAGAADKAPAQWRLTLVFVGLATSVPLIIAGGRLLMGLMERFPVIITFGGALLGFLAGGMFVSDPSTLAWFEGHLPAAEWVVGLVSALLVVVAGKWMKARRDAPGAP